jgi:predicted lysophospholipase L1 biosynthesis ABC-type transport system permease subunit
MSQQSYYESYRFAEVFAQLKRAPDSIASRISEIPGVGTAEFRVVADVTLDVPRLNEPAKGRIISIPEQRRAMLNELYLTDGRYVEPGIPDLYTQLKQTPAISSVSIPEIALASFKDTIARTINVSTVILIAFTVIIAFGMVYNGARIALSERGHELASLRVLGFTRSEIGFMLLGEQAILTLVAIPVGFALGYGIAGLITVAIDTELIRFPLFISARSYALPFLVVAGSAFLSGYLVQWRLRHLDLVAVLKTRE